MPVGVWNREDENVSRIHQLADRSITGKERYSMEQIMEEYGAAVLYVIAGTGIIRVLMKVLEAVIV